MPEEVTLAYYDAHVEARGQNRVNLPSKVYIKEPWQKTTRYLVEKCQVRTRFSMLPEDVLGNRELSSTAKIAYAAMGMESWGSGTIAISHQALASICGVNRRTIQPALQGLCVAGLLEPLGPPVGQVQPYRLMHPEFAAKAGVQASVGKPTLARGFLICGKCKRQVKGLMRMGWCRGCSSEAKLDRKIDAKLDQRLGRQEIAS